MIDVDFKKEYPRKEQRELLIKDQILKPKKRLPAVY
jgi:hypothetical protein